MAALSAVPPPSKRSRPLLAPQKPHPLGLPPELIGKVGDYLGASDLFRFECVSNTIRQALSVSLATLGCYRMKMTHADLANTVKRYPNLRAVRILDCLEIEDIACLTRLQWLERLCLTHSFRLSAAAVDATRECRNLKHLSIIGVSGCAAGVSGPAANGQLETLDLSGANIHVIDATIHSLRANVRLRALSLSLSLHLTSAGIASLAHFKKLERLDLGDCSSLTDENIAHVALPELQDLSLEGCSLLTDRGVAHLKACPRLKRLNLDDCSRLTGASIDSLTNILGQLEALNLRKVQLTDKDVAKLSACRRLRRLDLSCSRSLSHASIDSLQDCSQLEELHLRDCQQFQDGDLSGLQNCRQLIRLELWGVHQLTDKTIDFLIDSLPQLERLNLSGCPLLTMNGMARLGGLGQLQLLSLCGNPQLTENGVAYLAGALKRRLRRFLVYNCPQVHVEQLQQELSWINCI